MIYHIYYSNFVLPNNVINKKYSNKLYKCICPNLYVLSFKTLLCTNFQTEILKNENFEAKIKFLESEIYETEIFENENFLKEILKLKF